MRNEEIRKTIELTEEVSKKEEDWQCPWAYVERRDVGTKVERIEVNGVGERGRKNGKIE